MAEFARLDRNVELLRQALTAVDRVATAYSNRNNDEDEVSNTAPVSHAHLTPVLIFFQF